MMTMSSDFINNNAHYVAITNDCKLLEVKITLLRYWPFVWLKYKILSGVNVIFQSWHLWWVYSHKLHSNHKLGLLIKYSIKGLLFVPLSLKRSKPFKYYKKHPKVRNKLGTTKTKVILIRKELEPPQSVKNNRTYI